MKKKWKIIIVVFLLIAVVIGVGGKIYMDKREEEKIEAERMSVEALKNTFKDIKSVEFEKSAYNEMTGSYRMFIQMTNQSDESVKFSYSFSKETPEKTGGYMLKDKGVQVKGETKNKVQVIYSNKEKDEV